MDLTIVGLALYLGATFVGAFVAGLAGFAFALIASAIWLHFLPPLQAATLIIGFGLLVQGIGTWKVRRSFDWDRLWPFAVGGLAGVPLGAFILSVAEPRLVRLGAGIIMVAFSLYGLARPAVAPIRFGGRALDAVVGVFNGILGVMTGYAALLITIWSGLRGWSKETQRGVFQPVALFVFGLSALTLGLRGDVGPQTLSLFALGLPVFLLGTWLGLRLFDRVDEAAFRRVVLGLLLLSGIFLIYPL